ncbi:ARPP-2 domain-containing protein [Micromonospora sp. NPDC049366]|uniref:ARPP-2 domain-containing protein n=1 Tax=Micromonospora sp. NPDC049366 TaxID=3364271 RepID=UPI00378F6A9A
MTAATDGIDLTGLTAGPAQTWGAIRLVPLLRPRPITDLRLHARLYDPDELSVVHTAPRAAYLSYIPHAYVATWTTDTTPAAAYGTQLRDPADTLAPNGIRLTFRRRLARREDRQRLRFLPLHLAMEGYLALHFGGPPIAWQEWTRHAVTRGLSPRVEAGYTGAAIAGLDDALRVFEIHPDQCGMLLYAADALAAAFVVPHPDDYRSLHPTLLQDFYGELLFHYTHLYEAVPDFTAHLDDTRIASIADLRAQLAQVDADWKTFHALMADGLFAAERLTVTPVQRMGRFTLARFLPVFDPDVDNHIGETITDEAGRLAYLKTFRLSAAQTRRGHLLSQLAANDWNLDVTATTLGTERDALVQRLDRAGFGHLLRPDIIDSCRRRARELRGRGTKAGPTRPVHGRSAAG